MRNDVKHHNISNILVLLFQYITETSENTSMRPKTHVVLFSCIWYAQYAMCKCVWGVLCVSEGWCDRYMVAKGVRSAAKFCEVLQNSAKFFEIALE
jgi:hypothetical protein